MKIHRYSLPDERPGLPESLGAVLRRGWFLLFLFEAPVVSSYIVHGQKHGEWDWSILPALIAAYWAYGLWHGLITGEIHSRGKYYYRRTEPGPYWRSILFLLLGVALLVTALFQMGPPAK
jgi:hypothetical protein